MSMYDLYKEAYTPWEWHEKLFSRCKEVGMICFSSPFITTAVDFLEELNCPCYKLLQLKIQTLLFLKK